jgi:hypothetical protein
VLVSGILQVAEGLAVDELAKRARDFFRGSTMPELGRPYQSCAYEPMVQLLAYLDANGFKTFIASGGGRDFMREFSEQLYGVPRDRVIGSSVGLEFRDDDGEPRLVLTRNLEVLDDGPQKPIRIWDRTGRRPILAAGNSNGDIEMLRFTAGSPASLCLLVHHDDAKREFAYDTGAEEALTTADRRGWTVISMARDWANVFGDPARMGEHRRPERQSSDLADH